MKKKFESFSNRLTRSVVLTVQVIMTIISVFAFFVLVIGMLVFSKAHYADIMDKAQESMALIMSKVEVSSDNILDEMMWHLDTPELVISTLEYELNTNRHIYGCAIGFVPDYYPSQGRWFEPYILNGKDGIVVKSIGSASHDYFNADWYLNGMESAKGVWSNPYLDSDGAETVLCTFSRRLETPDGEVAGVFGVDLSLNGMSTLVEDYIRKENDKSPFIGMLPNETVPPIYGFIIGPDGDYIVHPDGSRILKTSFYDFATGKGADKYRLLGDSMRAGKSGDATVIIDGIRSDVYYAPLLNSGWSMGIVVPVKRLHRPGLMFGCIIILLILAGLLTVLFICRSTIKKTSKPLIQLSESAREVAAGRFDAELPQISTNDELRLLRDSFDNMQKSLAEYVDELTRTTAQRASIESELGVARNIQMSMLPMTWPAFPDRPDLDIFGFLNPAKAVGGDLYDFRLRDGKLFFCIGDVSGKGIPASLVMTVVSSMFRTLSASEDNPAKIISSVNSSMAGRNDSQMFVTLFVGSLDLSSGEVLYSNAGHNAPIVISEGVPRMLEADANVPVGVMEEWDYSLQKFSLPAGSTLFLYTDGLTEATRSGGGMFGEEKVLEALSGQSGDISAAGIIHHMSEEVAVFVGDSEQSDDLTMLAFRVLS